MSIRSAVAAAGGVRKAGGSLVAVIVGFLALADAPEQLEKWKRGVGSVIAMTGVDWAMFWSGDGGRWTLLLVALIIGLWTWEVPQRLLKRTRPGATALPPVKDVPVSREAPSKFSIDVFAHKAAKDDPLVQEIFGFFKEAGWTVVLGYTELAQHAEGVFVKGPSTTAHRILKWALRDLGIEARIDAAQDQGKWQVIVGAGAQKTRTLLEALEALGSSTKELGLCVQERATLKRQRAIDCLEWFSEKAKIQSHERGPIRATIRFADYKDTHIVNEIKKILEEHTNWETEIDGSNRPTIMPDQKFKVMFESGLYDMFDQVAWAFHYGELVSGVVGKRIADRPDVGHLIIYVFPTV